MPAAYAGTLSDREIEVLQAFADGLQGPAVAKRLHVEWTTVRCHAKNIRTKLGARTTTQAVAIAMRQGLVQ